MQEVIGQISPSAGCFLNLVGTSHFCFFSQAVNYIPFMETNSPLLRGSSR